MVAIWVWFLTFEAAKLFLNCHVSIHQKHIFVALHNTTPYARHTPRHTADGTVGGIGVPNPSAIIMHFPGTVPQLARPMTVKHLPHILVKMAREISIHQNKTHRHTCTEFTPYHMLVIHRGTLRHHRWLRFAEAERHHHFPGHRNVSRSIPLKHLPHILVKMAREVSTHQKQNKHIRHTFVALASYHVRVL